MRDWYKNETSPRYINIAALSRDSTFRAYVRAERATIRPDGGLAFPTATEGLHQRYQELTELLAGLDVDLRVEGTAEATVGSEVKSVHENESIYIPIGTVHRLANQGKIPLELIEVQTGSYLGEDDIVRIEDVYKRN